MFLSKYQWDEEKKEGRREGRQEKRKEKTKEKLVLTKRATHPYR